MIFILGLCVGSFINMAVYRTASSYKVIKLKVFKVKDNNRSYCDFCGKQLHWYENIPVVSWLFLGGETKCCKKKLSVLYPIVELGTAILFLLIGQNWLGLAVAGVLVFLMVFDGKYMLLPDKALYLLIVLGIFGGYQNWLVGITFGLIFFMMSKFKIRGQEAMGNGDPYLAIFIGLWLGWVLGLVALYIAFITGAIYGIVLLFLKKIKKVDPLPFGPFLIGGTIISYINSQIILYYLNRWF